MSPKKILTLIAIILINTAVLFLLVSGNTNFNLQKKVELPFQADAEKEYLALYLGYVGCPSVCPTALNKLAAFQDEISDKNFQFFFVNLIDEMKQERVEQYAQSFHPQFKGVQLSPKERQYLVEKLHAFYSEAQPTINRQTAHSDYVYFFSKSKASSDWILEYITPPTSIDLLLKTYKNTKTND